MKIQTFQAAQTYSAAKSALRTNDANPASAGKAPGETNLSNPTFDSVHALTKAVAQGEQAALSYMTSDADPHSVIEAIAAAELAVETAVTIRDKVVEAYQELIRMPI
ncbi:MAG: flagellar hook-basal body complex protein FliE [Pseudomonadota bacterium]